MMLPNCGFYFTFHLSWAMKGKERKAGGGHGRRNPFNLFLFYLRHPHFLFPIFTESQRGLIISKTASSTSNKPFPIESFHSSVEIKPSQLGNLKVCYRFSNMFYCHFSFLPFILRLVFLAKKILQEGFSLFTCWCHSFLHVSLVSQTFPSVKSPLVLKTCKPEKPSLSTSFSPTLGWVFPGVIRLP